MTNSDECQQSRFEKKIADVMRNIDELDAKEAEAGSEKKSQE